MSKEAETMEDAAARGLAKFTIIPAPMKPPRRKRRSRRWILAPLMLAAIGAGYHAWSRNGGEPATAMITQAVMRGDIENSVTAVGTLDAINSVDAGAQVSGQLKSLHVEIGDKIEANQLVAEIDPATIENRIEIDQAELANLEAQLVSKKAQLVLKQANIERQRNLVATNSVSQSTLDQAVADHAAAAADVDAISAQIRKQKATLAGDKVDLGYTKIYAPVAGTIVANPAKEGQTLNANQTTPTIVTIADLSTITSALNRPMNASRYSSPERSAAVVWRAIAWTSASRFFIRCRSSPRSTSFSASRWRRSVASTIESSKVRLLSSGWNSRCALTSIVLGPMLGKSCSTS
ncbi:Macrolide export protein MacA [Ensifer psoraleae]|nr:Macrolide export protein MacA [Sinorhizobium psoraleae]